MLARAPFAVYAVRSILIYVISDDLFFPTETSSYLGILVLLPPFSAWVTGSWLDEESGVEVQMGLPKPPHLPGVYVFASAQPFGRLQGASDILYLGCTRRGDLRGRLNEYARIARAWPYAPPGRKGAELKIAGYYTKHGSDLKLGWLTETSPDAARKREGELLSRYDHDHGETPPFNGQRIRNRRWPRRVSPTVTTAVCLRHPSASCSPGSRTSRTEPPRSCPSRRSARPPASRSAWPAARSRPAAG